MLGVGVLAGLMVGVVVGFGLAIALVRGYVRRLEERHQADADRPEAAATPAAAPPRDTQPTRRPRGRPARATRAPRHQPTAAINPKRNFDALAGGRASKFQPIIAPPATSAPIATVTTDDITLPRDIVEQVYAHLARLEVLDRRASLRLVRRTGRLGGTWADRDH